MSRPDDASIQFYSVTAEYGCFSNFAAYPINLKDQVMLDAVRAKFSQHDDLKAILLGTGNARLIEHTDGDRYWADGGDGTGKNMLGQILLQIRDELRS